MENNTVELLYLYYGSYAEYDNNWKMTVQQFVNFLNDDILNDSRFDDFIDDQIQWSHGFEGRILMSDSKNRTAYFDSSQKLTYTKNRNYFEENLKELNKALVCFV